MLASILIVLAFLSLAWTAGQLLGKSIILVVGEDRLFRWIEGK